MGTLVRLTTGIAALGLLVATDMQAQSLPLATISPKAGIGKNQGLISTNAPIRSINASVQSAAQYRVFDSLFNAFSYYTGGIEPFRYDPASNTLVTIKRGFTGSSDNVYVRKSSDMGMTWTAPKGPLHQSSQGNARYPGITILNKNNSSNPADLLYYFTFPVVIGEAFGTSFNGFLDGNLELISPAEANTGAQGSDNTLHGWSTDSKSVWSNDGNVGISAGDMADNNLGIRRYDLSNGTLEALLPDQIAAQNFSDPQDVNSRTSLVVGLGRDGGDNQKVYLGIMSRFPATDAEAGTRPYPAVTVSNDEGKTWSALDILPVATVRQYAEANGANPDSTLFPYNQAQDFIVTGADKYSFIMNLFEVNADKDDAETMRQIVEVYRSNGNWGIRKVADISGIIFTFDPIAPETTRRNQMANEAHISRTADGKTLVVHWTEVLSKVFERDINGDDATPDTLTTSDVFVAIRKLGQGTGNSTWSETPLNVTNSDIVDRITWIPPVISNDLSNVPLLTLQTKLDGSESSDQDRWVTVQLNSEREQLVTMSNIDLTSLAGVNNETVTTTQGAELRSVSPNPVSAGAAINFSLPKAGHASVTIWNQSGQRVATLANGMMEAGDHTVQLDASMFASGMYYCTLATSGETVTNSFTVVR